MQKNLVIVESPAKAKTIEKFLGKDFKVLSSYGHIRDLKKKEFSIDVDKNFKPSYEIPADKKALVNTAERQKLKRQKPYGSHPMRTAREKPSPGICMKCLKLKPENTKRIVFHEITKGAILKAIEQPRDIDINLVNAQQARRILDRIVGFELSPVLWRKVKPALSAGRVQSVAVRLIVEREREIHAFQTGSMLTVLLPYSSFRTLTAKLVEMKAELARRIKTKEEAKAFLERMSGSELYYRRYYYPSAQENTRLLRSQPLPCNRKLPANWDITVAQTMMVAQRLYESGFITYMRTDSVNLSELAVNASQ